MTFFISGGAKNGKSTLAQNLAVALAKGNTHYYVATMIPVDDEDRLRIQRHIEDREGLGFTTLECGRNILSCLEHADPKATFLLDSVTALLMNELFREDKGYQMDLEAIMSQFDYCVQYVNNAARPKWKSGVVDIMTSIYNGTVDIDTGLDSIQELINTETAKKLADA